MTTNESAPGFAPAAQGAPAAARCMVCGAFPALQVMLRDHQGMVLLSRTSFHTGVWCRDCGISEFRRIQSRSMLLGWWGVVSFFVNIYVVARNATAYTRLKSLSEPAGRMAAGLPQRRPVVASPGFMVIAVLVLFLLYTAVAS